MQQKDFDELKNFYLNYIKNSFVLTEQQKDNLFYLETDFQNLGTDSTNYYIPHRIIINQHYMEQYNSKIEGIKDAIVSRHNIDFQKIKETKIVFKEIELKDDYIYESDSNTLFLNMIDPKTETIIDFFKSLEFARTAHYSLVSSKNNDRLINITSFWTGQTKHIGNVLVYQGEMLSQAANEYRAETIFHALKKDDWMILENQKEFKFPNHTFPSKFSMCKLACNYFSQISAFLGINEEKLCKLIEQNQYGREKLTKHFDRLAGRRNAFNRFETLIDYIAIVEKFDFQDCVVNAMCDASIYNSQLMLFSWLADAYKNGRINKVQFQNRFKKFERLITNESLRHEINMLAKKIYKHKKENEKEKDF